MMGMGDRGDAEGAERREIFFKEVKKLSSPSRKREGSIPPGG